MVGASPPGHATREETPHRFVHSLARFSTTGFRMTEKTAANLVRTAVFVWSLIFALSVFLAIFPEKAAETTASGFTPGANRAEIFFLWQFLALGMAVVSAVCARLARTKIRKPVRGLGYLPLAVHLVLGVLLLCMALVAVLLM